MLREHADLLPVIAAGGAIGALARWGLATALPHGPDGFPWNTFITNITGCLLLGLLMAYVLGPGAGTRYLRPFVGVGILGGYTTFSTYELDARGLVDVAATPLALVYLVASVALGTAAAWLGLTIGRVLVLDTGREVVVDGIDPDLDPDPPHHPDGSEGAR
ncbi:MAG: CrcB family protein [Nocardioides sp.]|nr:CrcB family protein [Nocardioides sp.]